MALALVEAGARAVYCVDLPKEPGEEWTKVRDYAKRLDGIAGEGRLEYLSADVRDQERMWKIGETIGDREGRLDACVAAAGILKSHTDCLEYPAKQFEDVSNFAHLHTVSLPTRFWLVWGLYLILLISHARMYYVCATAHTQF